MLLNFYNNLDKINNMTSVKIKVFIGKTLHYIKRCINDEKVYYEIINKAINYSQWEIKYTIDLFKLCEKYPK